MKLDRNLQREILQILANAYPNPANADDLKALLAKSGEEVVTANMLYLEEHGLINAHSRRRSDGTFLNLAGEPLITHRGLDFLQDDGGLSAILGIVTIKIHDDTLRLLIEGRILQSDLSQPDKRRWLDQLRELPAETTKHLVLKLVDLGLENSPTALAAIGTALGLGAV